MSFRLGVALLIILAALMAFSPGQTPATAGDVIRQGDADCSGAVDALDGLAILADAAGLPPGAACLHEAGDTNCDARRDTLDALRILRHVAGVPNTSLSNCTSVGEPLTGRLLLNEVLFLPEEEAAPFVELTNVGPTPASTDGFTLANEAGHETEIDGLGPVAPGGLLLLQGDVLTTLFGDLIDDGSGYIELRAGDDVLDRVAFGDDPNAVPMTLGSIDFDPEAGRSLNRVPGTTAPGRQLWAPGDPTPGGENTVDAAPVEPPDGAVVSPGEALLAWYPTPGATEYRVELATDGAFTETIVDGTTTGMQFETPPLAEGEYFWRVTPDLGPTAAASSLTVSAVAEPAGVPVITVPFVPPVKDSPMLLLESRRKTGFWPWDAPHENFQITGPFAAGAAIAMVNRAYGGNITVDRVAYHIFKDRMPGPERDLPYQDAFPANRMADALQFALGSAVEQCFFDDEDQAWAYLTTVLNASIPVISVASEGGVAVIRGYQEVGAVEPARNVRFISPVTHGEYLMTFTSANLHCFWHPAGEIDPFVEPLNDYLDLDQDGIIAFDEINRFHTDPNNADSDGDGLNDKEEIAETVFHPEFGYSRSFDRHDPRGRDYDRDTLPKEIDCDADDDGTRDGDDGDDFDGSVPGQVDPECTTPTAYKGQTRFGQRGDDTNPTIVAFADEILFVKTGPMRFEAVSGMLTYTYLGKSGINCEIFGFVQKEIEAGDAQFDLFFPGPPAQIIAQSNTNDLEIPVTRECTGQPPVEETRTAVVDWFFEQGGYPVEDPTRIKGRYEPDFAHQPVWTWDLRRTAAPP